MLSRYNVISPLSPFSGVSSNPLSASMSRLFQDFETVFARSAFSPSTRRVAGPRVQLRDQGESIAMLADLPGLRLEDIDLVIEGATITLKTRPEPVPVPEGFTALRRERQPAAVEWSFELPYAVDVAHATAKLDQGRLSVTLPKAPEARPRTISVKAG
jgi:HSP20 family protein